jgi:Tol biopolymer transport system component
MRATHTGVLLFAGALAVGAPLLARADPELKGRICYARKEGDNYLLHVMDADGKNDRAIPNLPGKVNIMPAWSPDGKRIAFMGCESMRVQDGCGIYQINPDGSGLKRLVENEKLAALPAWSPDGKRLMFVVDRNDSPQLMASNADGSDARELRTGMRMAVAPFFSPDGKRIAFSGSMEEKDSDRSLDLYTANPDGTDVQKATAGGFNLAGAAAWSPDGKAIVYARLEMETRSGSLHLWLPADKVDTRLADLKLDQTAGDLLGVVLPNWSPDGQWLIMSQPAGEGKSSLIRISADGKTQERIGPADASCYCPAWGN